MAVVNVYDDGGDGGAHVHGLALAHHQPPHRPSHGRAHADDGPGDGQNIDCSIHLLVPVFYSVSCNRPKVCAYVLAVYADMWQANYGNGDFEPSLAFVLNSKLWMPQAYLSNLAAVKLCF